MHVNRINNCVYEGCVMCVLVIVKMEDCVMCVLVTMLIVFQNSSGYNK